MSGFNRLTTNVRFLGAMSRSLPKVLRMRPGSGRTVADVFEAAVEADPDHPALVMGDTTMTYAELDREANRVARWAQAQGIAMGDVVALLMENRPEFVVHWMGLAKIGAVTALINTNLSGHPLAHSLGVSKARHLILDKALDEHFATARDEVGSDLEVWSSGGEIAGASDLDADRAGRSGASLPSDVRRGLDSSDNLFYIYTSGTTGLPKAANFSHFRFGTVALAVTGITKVGPGDRMYVCLPLYHSAGGVMALGGAILNGATAVLARKFSASHFWEDCVRHDVTLFQYIGELCRYLLNAPEHPDERRHKIRLCVGNGLRGEVWEPFQERFGIPEIVEFYGATEGNVVFVNGDNKVGSIGRLPRLVQKLQGMHLVKFDVENEEVVRGKHGFCLDCEIGEAGEAIGRITNVGRFEGYTDEKASEKKVLRDVFEKGDAYFRTGDLLRRDDEDYFYFVDRIGDTFRWKGENVSTGEVAEVLSLCAGVKEANVYGVTVEGADGRAGMASLVVADGFDIAQLHRQVAEQLASYSRPLFVRLGREIEITGTFKHRKVDAVKEGFDPEQIADPLYFLDAQAGAYLPLDAARYRAIQSGEIRV
ncbi:MAG: long-chain-acyl-CoA synthetase [Myxococcota bacterium]|nr:long-chain-acyl-CoA synthetase [Myxococcota bacterium]